MGLRFIKQGDFKSQGQVLVPVPAGKYKQFLVEVEVVIAHSAGHEATLSVQPVSSGTFTGNDWVGASHLARYRLVRGAGKGGELQNTTLGYIHKMNDLKGGAPLATGNGTKAAALYAYSAIIPLQLLVTRDSAPNCLDVKNETECFIELQADSLLLNATTNTITSWAWYVFGVTDDTLVETYQLDIHEQQIQASGAGRLGDTLAGANIGIVHLFPTDSSNVWNEAAITGVTLEQDGVSMVANIDDKFVNILSNWENQLETYLNGLREFLLASRSGFVGFAQGFSRSVRMEFQFATAGSAYCYKHSVKFDANRTNQSVAVSQAIVESKLNAAAVAEPDVRPALAKAAIASTARTAV